MASMVKKAGTALATGATDTGITGVHTQSSGRSAAGELLIIHNETGDDLSVYVKDPHKEMSFEAVIEASVTDESIGEIVTIGTGTGSAHYIVTKWDVIESNDDVKKVSIGLRETSLST